MFGWMAMAKESHNYQQFSAQNSSFLDLMAPPQIEKNYSLPFFPIPKPTTGFSFPASNLPGLSTDQQKAVSGFQKPVTPCCNLSNMIGNPYLNDSQYVLPHGLGFTDKAFEAPQKRLLIFDQSGDHTRLFFCPSFSPQGPILASKTPAGSNGPFDLVAARVDEQFLMTPMVEEKWAVNHLSDGEDEMLEDTEEIDDLLYSDSDDDDEYDEVTSKRHYPFISFEEGCNKDRSLDDEQVASSDENSSKRRRLLDGKCKKSSLDSAESPVKQAISSHYKDDAESSCAGYRNPCDDIESNERDNEVKVCQALMILETIIPGLDSKDPISILDKAVAYLKSMKTEAEALGLGYPVVP